MIRKLIFLTLFLFSAGSVYSQVDLVSNLVASYPFDQINGANDVSGNGLNGTILGVVTLTTDRFGNPNSAYEFGGNVTGSDYIRVATNPLLSFSGQSFSISFWALRVATVTGNDFMIAKGQDIAGNSFGFRFEDNSRTSRFRFGSPNDLASLDTAYFNTWVNYVGTYDDVSDVMSFYEDGVLMDQKVVPNYKVSNNYPLIFGRHFTNFDGSGGNPYPFRGKMDEVKIYTRVLNSCEAYALSNDLTTCFGVNQGLAARYDFCSSAKDGSGNGNNGTILGGSFVDDRFGNSLSAFSVDGINDYMRVANNSTLNITSDMAISAWYKPVDFNGGGNVPLVVKPGSTFSQYQLGVSGNQSAVGSTEAFFMSESISASNQKVKPAVTLTWVADEWYHLVGVYNGTSSTLSLFVNGRKLNTITVTGAPDIYASDLFIGGLTSTGAFLKGTIDDIRIYNRKIYKSDIKALHNLASPTVTCCALTSPILSSATICGPGSVTLTGLSGIVETGTVIHWASYDFPLSVLGMGKTFITPLITSTSLFYTSNYYFGCEGSNGFAVAYINPVPTVTGLNGAKSVCPNITNIGYGINSVSGTTYKWFVNGGSLTGGISTGDTVGVDWGASNSNAKVKVLPTNIYGCIGDTAIRNVTVNIILKTETPVGDSIICLNKSSSLTYQIQPTNGSSYTWIVFPGTIVGGNNSNVVTINPSLDGQLTQVSVKEDVTTICKGQSDVLYLHVYQNPDTTLSIQGGLGVCGDSLRTPRVFSLNGFSNSTYNWTVASGLVSVSGANNTITLKSNAVNVPVDNEIKVLEVSDKGCIGKVITSTITTGKPFQTKINYGDTKVCTGDLGYTQTKAYFADGFENSYYNWTSDKWAHLEGLTFNGTAFILTNPGTGFIKVKETPPTPNVCPNYGDSIQVTVLQSPTNTTITGRFAFCQGTLNVDYTLDGMPNSTYSWWIQDNTIKTGQGTNKVTIDFLRSGDLKLRVLEIASNGCLGDSAATFMKPIRIFATPRARNLAGDSILCATQLDSVKYSLYEGFDNSKFYWDVTGGNSTILGLSDTKNIKVQIDSSTWQTRRWVKVVEVSGDGCVGDTVRKFVRIDRPAADIKSVSVSESNEKTIELNYANASHNASFVREPGTTTSLSFNTVQYQDNNLKTDIDIYQYQIKEKDKCGKLYESSVHNNMVLRGKVDSTYGSVKLNWNSYNGWSQGVKEYEVWRMIGESGTLEKYKTVSVGNLNDSIVVAADGPVQIFRIKAVGNDETRIAASNPVKLLFNDVPRVYSAFSPNGDHINDTWIVDRLNLYPNNKVTVMDKWGTPVFEKSNYLGEWDGTHDGHNVPAGIYYYVIEIGSGRKPISGTISVLR